MFVQVPAPLVCYCFCAVVWVFVGTVLRFQVCVCVQYGEKRQIAPSTLSIRVEQLGFHWMDFY